MEEKNYKELKKEDRKPKSETKGHNSRKKKGKSGE